MPADVAIELEDGLDSESRALIERAELPVVAARLVEGESLRDDVEVTVLLAGPDLLRELNREHRDIDEPTDVLSFPAAEGEEFPSAPGEPRYLGDIAVSIATVAENAAAARLTPELELRHVVVHGLLHLLGYDHETPDEDATMRAREESILGTDIHAGRGDEAHADHQ